MARQPEDSSSSKSASTNDSELIRELATLLDETNLTEIEIERSGLRVRVARNVSVAAIAPAIAQVAAPAAVAAAPGAGSDVSKHPGLVPSPMVGTAYWASSRGPSRSSISVPGSRLATR